MEGKSEGGLFALMGGLLQESTVVIVAVIFAGWVKRKEDQLP